MNKLGKRKLLIIILVLIIAIATTVVVVVVKPFDGKGENNKVELQPNQIMVGGEAYTFSALNGIDNFDQIDASDGEYKSTYTFTVADKELRYSNFTLYDVETYDGVAQNMRPVKTEELGWRYRGAFVPGGTYFQYYTEAGVIDWNAIEEDYNKVMAEGSFKNLAYYDALQDICENTADECIEADDVAGLEEYGTNSYADSKLYIMSILAHGKLCNQLANGEIDYFVLIFEMFSGQPAALKVYVYGAAEGTGTSEEVSTEATTEEAKLENTVPELGSIIINGKSYNISVENGIDNWRDVGEDIHYMHSMDTDVNGVVMGNGVFSIYTDFVLSDGVTPAVSAEELLEKGYMQQNQSDEYFIYVTSKGYESFDVVEADYEMIVRENSFQSLDYVDVMPSVGADRVKSYISMDDVEGALGMLGGNGGDPKSHMMNWLMRARCTKMLVDGEIDYYICQSVIVDEEDGAELILGLSAMSENVDTWGSK